MTTVYEQTVSLCDKPEKHLLFIHGWGMNSGVWRGIVPILAGGLPDYEITLVDLPGYGKSPAMNQVSTSASLARALRPLLRENSSIVAWSMGGLVAIELATLAKENIQQLVLVSSTPRFVQANDWPFAVEAQIFQSFVTSLEKDYRGTLSRFLAIQTLGSATARQDIKKIQHYLSFQGEAEPLVLRQGLQILLQEDKRQQLSSLSLPVTFIAGNRDSLVKLKALEQLAQRPNISLQIMPAGHAPFISNPQQFVELLLKTL